MKTKPVKRFFGQIEYTSLPHNHDNHFMDFLTSEISANDNLSELHF